MASTVIPIGLTEGMMLRNIGGVVGGLIAGIVAYVIVAIVSSMFIHVSASVNPHQPTQVRSVFEALPVALKLTIMVDWFVAGLVGGLTAKWIAGRTWPVWGVAIPILLVVAMTVAVLPMPAWLQAGWLAAPLLGALLAHHYGPIRSVQPDAGDAEPDETYA